MKPILHVVGFFSVVVACALAPMAGAEVACPGAYGGHLQGIAVEPGEAVYWPMTVAIVKTDLEGNLLAHVEAPGHQGDLVYHEGKVYVAVNLGAFNQEPGRADSWVYVYDAKDLSLVAKHEVQEVVHGAGGMACHDGHFYVVGGLPEGYHENYVYEYDADFAFVKRHVLDSGYTLLGIQTAARWGGYWWFGCYGNPQKLLKVDDSFRTVGIYVEDWSVGIDGISETECFRGLTGKDEAGKWWGKVKVGVPGTTRNLADSEVAHRLSEAKEPVRVVCFGDSVTGVYYHSGGRRAYPEMLEVALRQAFPKATVDVINAGISGHTTVDALARIDKDVLAHKPHAVTVMFGLNDMTRVPIEDYERNLGTITQKCRDIGAEVFLCTPNSVYETPRRPVAKLEEYAAVVRRVAAAQEAPLVDCYASYEAVRAKAPLDWALLMSEDIHPNMWGHKLFAEDIARVVTGRLVPLAKAGPPSPLMPRTAALLGKGQPVKVYAMPPYDAWVGPALKAVWPEADVQVTSWPVAGQTLAQIEESAKQVREMKPDLVVVAAPPAAAAASEGQALTEEAFVRSYSWVLNYGLSFGHQEWDCIAVAPSVTESPEGEQAKRWGELARRVIQTKDIGMVERDEEGGRSAEEVFTMWIRAACGAN